jgi:hypothetical protein
VPVLVDPNLAVCFHPAQLLLYLLPVQIVTGFVHGFCYFHRSAGFKQVQGVTDAERDAAWKRIKSAAKKHKVELNEQNWRELT